MNSEDYSLETVGVFDRQATRYNEKYFALKDYDVYYDRFLSLLPAGAQAVVDIACGPGNVASYVHRARPEIAVTGLDLSPRMVALAQAQVPSARFLVMDCRALALGRPKFGPGQSYQGAVYAFGLSYLNDADVTRFFVGLDTLLAPCAVLLLMTITSRIARAGFEVASTGDRVYVAWRTPGAVLDLVAYHGYEIEFSRVISSPANATQSTEDLVVIARKKVCDPELGSD